MARQKKASDEYLKQMEEDLNTFEVKLKVLRAEYNRYFVGARKELPRFTEIQIQKIIKKYVADKQLRGSHRFKLFNLIARYNTLREFWGRRIRFMEDGLKIGTRTNLNQGPNSPYQQAAASGRDSMLSMDRPSVIRAQKGMQSDIRMLYINYVRAIRRTIGDEVSVPYDKFHTQIMEKFTTIRKKRCCDAVQFRIDIEDGNVRLKAKPLKDGESE
ncbi:hypothetical protein JW905_01910 [bacterium]|nr:hypothetical protein [candidate division CSSED10-310 bacterium]